MTVEDTLIFLYSLVPVVNGLAYCPQIYGLYKSPPEETRSTSLGMWAIWVACAFIATLYSSIIVQDQLYAITSFVNFVACFVVAALTLFKKLQDRGHLLLMRETSIFPRISRDSKEAGLS